MPDDRLRVGQAAVFSGEWLRYPSVAGRDRFHEGYRGVLLGWWNGSAEFSVDEDAAGNIAAIFTAMADYVGGDWRTVDFDGRLLTVRRPPSLGGGVALIPPEHGRYRIGWGLPWHPVDPAAFNRVIGQR